VLSIREMLALRGLLQEALGSESAVPGRASSLMRTAVVELDKAGGIAGVRSLVEELISSPAPKAPANGSGAAARAPAGARVAASNANVLAGVAIGPGQASGTVHVVAEPGAGDAAPGAGGASAAGSVLVCKRIGGSWDPGDTAPAAIVIETGSASSAAMRAARQRGIAAVRLPEATARLRDGQTVTVNGDTGTITLATP
jgi:pyruvate,water dikinase